MSNERKPLLSDEEIIDETWVPDMSSWEPAGAYEAGMHWARRYYEDLITTGKLRVVEEVDVVLMDGSSIMGHCNGCGIATLKQHAYCPGCGNKIKQTKQ